PPLCREQSPLYTTEFPQRQRQLTLAGVSRQLTHQQGGTDFAFPDRGRNSQHLIPVPLDESSIRSARHHARPGTILFRVAKGVQPFVGDVLNAWREAETQQISARTNLVGRPSAS